MLSSLGVKKFNLAISPSSFTHGGAYYHGISVTVPLAKFTDTLLPPRTQVLALQELPASAGACLWQAAPGNAYPSLPGNAHPILLGNAHPIFARHNKDKTTIPFRHS